VMDLDVGCLGSCLST